MIGVLVIGAGTSCAPWQPPTPTRALASPSAIGPSATSSPSQAPKTLQARLAGWTLPAPLSRMVVFASGGRLVIAGGYTASGTSTASVVVADPIKGTPTEVGQLAIAVHDAGGASIGENLYIFGGGNSAPTATVQSLVPGLAAQSRGSLPAPRADLAVAVLASTTYLVGGFDGTSTLAPVLATNDGTSFKTIARLNPAVRYPAVAALSGSLYVFGGDSNGQPSAQVQRVNLSTGAVDTSGRLPHPLSHAVAVVLDGEVWLIGGTTASGATDTILRFDPVSGTVTPAGTLPMAVSDAGAATSNGVAYLVGGEVGGAPTGAVVELQPAP